MEYELDTSGDVGPISAGAINFRFIEWSDLSPFTQGYIEALFAPEAQRMNEERIAARMPLRRVRFSDLAPETLARIIADCAAFPAAYPMAKESDADRAKRAGGYFWTNRNGGDYRAFPPLTVQLGDDGKVRFA